MKGVSVYTQEIFVFSFSDGKLEVCGLYSSFHIARMHVNLADPLLLGQAHEVKVYCRVACIPNISSLHEVLALVNDP